MQPGTGGLDKCRPGWLLDRSVRYPITNPRTHCGGGRVGVHTIYAFPNRTGYPDQHSRYDAYCVRGRETLSIHRPSHLFFDSHPNNNDNNTKLYLNSTFHTKLQLKVLKRAIDYTQDQINYKTGHFPHGQQ